MHRNSKHSESQCYTSTLIDVLECIFGFVSILSFLVHFHDAESIPGISRVLAPFFLLN